MKAVWETDLVVHGGPDASITDTQLAVFQSLKDLCARMRLAVSVRTLERTLDEFSRSRPDQKTAKQRFDEWFSCFSSELESQVYMLVLPHRLPYWHSKIWDGSTFLGGEIDRLLAPLSGGFKDAMFDAMEAGTCFAYATFTACVYHLMRVAEYGLVSVAASVNVPQEKTAKGWDGCVQGIESWIKTLESTKSAIDWQEQKKKYSDLCAWFTTIKNGWRNPVSHIPRVYSEGSAIGIFSAVTILFQHLRQEGFKQVQMPVEPMPLPSETV